MGYFIVPYTIILDAGHGGDDPGAVYQGRREKDDTLKLTLAVGEILAANGIDVIYTRTEDIYQTPFQKATIANQSGADFFISFHRNSSPSPNQYSGVETLVYNKSGIKYEMAENINGALGELGFENLGVKERPGLVVLRRTSMPALLVEAGFLNTDADNQLFDDRLNEIASAIAYAILGTLDMETVEDRYSTSANSAAEVPMISGNEPDIGLPDDMDNNDTVNLERAINPDSTRPNNRPESNRPSNRPGPDRPNNRPGSNRPNNRPGPENPDSNQPGNRPGPNWPPSRPEPPEIPQTYYRVQVGAYRNRPYADDLVYELDDKGFPAYVLFEDGLYKVQVGAYINIGNAIRMEQQLRRAGYSTWITT